MSTYEHALAVSTEENAIGWLQSANAYDFLLGLLGVSQRHPATGDLVSLLENNFEAILQKRGLVDSSEPKLIRPMCININDLTADEYKAVYEVLKQSAQSEDWECSVRAYNSYNYLGLDWEGEVIHHNKAEYYTCSGCHLPLICTKKDLLGGLDKKL